MSRSRGNGSEFPGMVSPPAEPENEVRSTFATPRTEHCRSAPSPVLSRVRAGLLAAGFAAGCAGGRAPATDALPDAGDGGPHRAKPAGEASATGGSTTGGASRGGSAMGANTSGGAMGGSTTGGASTSCEGAEGRVCGNDIGEHCGLTYEYWKDQGSGCLTNTSDGFSVEWNNINNLLGRKGLRPGSLKQIVNYDADYNPNGNSYLCVYGWTKNPLVEYYIVDSWGDWRPPGDEGYQGTVNSDGGTYDIYRTERVQQPSIEGTRTFDQYWSVRREKRTKGTITVANHVDAWEGNGMNMGKLYEVSMCVEGYRSSGSAAVRVSMSE